MAGLQGLPTPGLYTAAPAVRLDGQDAPELATGLLSLFVEETTEGLYRCEMTFGNWGSSGARVDYLYFDRQTLDFGKAIEVQMGAGDSQGTVFTGKITALEGRFPGESPPEITVLAEDRLQDLRMTRRTRTWENVSDSDLFSQVASDHSLTPQVELDGTVTHDVLAQVNQSDLAFLRDRALAIGAELWVDGDTLCVKSRGRRGSPEVSLSYGQRLREFTALADLAGQRTSVTVAGYDVSAKDTVSFEAGESAVSNETGALTGGSSLLSQAFGDRKEQIVHAAPRTDAEARAVAEAAYRSIARRFVSGQGVAEGDARIRVGTQVNLQGLGPLFAGKYYVVEVRHQFDRAEGYRTRFRVERPGIGV